MGNGLTLRVLADYNKFAATDRVGGQRNFDGWENLSTSIRTDWQRGKESATVTGRLSLGSMRQITPVPNWTSPYRSESNDPFRRNDWSLTGRWSRENADGGTTDVHLSTTQVDDDTPELGIRTSVIDLGVQQTRVTERTKTTFGLSFRNYSDRLTPTPLIAFTPGNKSVNTYGGFAQVDHKVHDSLRVTAGATVERNEYSGWEFQPNVRALWGQGESQTFWASASRAVRTPSRADHDVRLLAETRENNGLPVLVTLNGNPNFESETLVAFEIGTRMRKSASTFVDVTAFLNLYDNLRTFEAGTPFMEMNPTPHFVSPYFFANNLKAQTAGLEAVVTHEPDNVTRLDFAGSLFTERFTLKAGSTDPYGTRAGERQGNTPRYQFNLSASRQFSPTLTGSLNFMHRGGLDDPGIPSYNRLDARLAWNPTASLEISFVGRNILGKLHQEAPATLFEAPSRLGRSMEVQARWRF
ncbi:MAG TPA: TonB-dependent receptor [Fimbriimonadaceae bacterium]|nr:TonB-dependent receptor [Fimbriimonadaceae bacterium]